MRAKSTITLLAAVFATLLWVLIRDTYLAVVIEEATEGLAAWLGIPRATMIARAAPYVLSVGVISAAVITAYQIGTRERKQKPAFEFSFDESDPQFVRSDGHITFYFVGLHILSEETVDFPNVWALHSPLIQRMFALDASQPSRGVQIYEGGALDSEVTELFELFRLPPREFFDFRGPDDPLHQVQRFTLEARGRHCKPVRQNFEYDFNRTPMVRVLS